MNAKILLKRDNWSWLHTTEARILHSHRRENPKSQMLDQLLLLPDKKQAP
jgi:hypothetical protein